MLKWDLSMRRLGSG